MNPGSIWSDNNEPQCHYLLTGCGLCVCVCVFEFLFFCFLFFVFFSFFFVSSFFIFWGRCLFFYFSLDGPSAGPPLCQTLLRQTASAGPSPTHIWALWTPNLCVVKTFSMMISRRDHRNSTKDLRNWKRTKRGLGDGLPTRTAPLPPPPPLRLSHRSGAHPLKNNEH